MLEKIYRVLKHITPEPKYYEGSLAFITDEEATDGNRQYILFSDPSDPKAVYKIVAEKVEHT
mgnify:CR=1 FL=1